MSTKTITDPPRLRADAPKYGWKEIGECIDALTDPDRVLDLYDLSAHCQRCGTPVRRLTPLAHEEYYGIVFVGSECLRRLTLSWREKPNGNFVAKIGRNWLTVFRNSIGYWQIAFGNRRKSRFSGYLNSAEDALAVAWDFAMGGK